MVDNRSITGRKKVWERYDYMYGYYEQEIRPNDQILADLKIKLSRKRSECEKLAGRVQLQQDKIDRLIKGLSYFKK